MSAHEKEMVKQVILRELDNIKDSEMTIIDINDIGYTVEIHVTAWFDYEQREKDNNFYKY